MVINMALLSNMCLVDCMLLSSSKEMVLFWGNFTRDHIQYWCHLTNSIKQSMCFLIVYSMRTLWTKTDFHDQNAPILWVLCEYIMSFRFIRTSWGHFDPRTESESYCWLILYFYKDAMFMRALWPYIRWGKLVAYKCIVASHRTRVTLRP